MLISSNRRFRLIIACAVAGIAGDSFGGVQHEYQVTFDALWNSVDHPNFPAGARFSPVLGASHGVDFDIWSHGEVASAEVEFVAEVGVMLHLVGVIESAVISGDAQTKFSGPGPSAPGVTVTTTFFVDEAHPMVSLITKVAPSHDWFVGVDSLDLRDGSGVFVNEIVLDLIVWDAGAEPGNDFSSSGQAVEGGVIRPLENFATIFGGTAPIARVTVTRLTPLTGDLNDDGQVDTADLGVLLGVFGTNNPAADLNGDSIVDTADLGLLFGNFGASDF